MSAFLIAGGGTGGHLYPGIAVAQELRRRDPATRLLFVGTARGIEVTAVPKAGFDLELLPVSGLRNKRLAERVVGLARLPVALLQALGLVRRFQPNVAVSVGGYAAGPAVLAAWLSGIPCVVMEQNAVPGLTNRLLGRLARSVAASLPTDGFDPHKVRVVGNPVRADFIPVREQPYGPHTPLRWLCVGGSQGARALNDAMLAVAPLLAARGPAVEIVHQTGPTDFERVRRAYGETGFSRARVVPFIDDMPSELQACDLVLCRAGASTIAELTVCGRPSILVPFPFAAGDHQSQNAAALAAADAALHVPQSELTAERLWELVSALCSAPERLLAQAAQAHRLGKPTAAATIAEHLLELASLEVAHV